MKKLYSLLFFVFSFLAQAQIVNIPDANFKAKLLAADFSNNIASNINGVNIKIDSNSNGEIEVSEALTVYSLDVSYDYNVNDITGIEAFVNLKSLNCESNQLTVLDVSQNVNLHSLNCYSNQLTSLDISQNINLVYLDCAYNLLTSIDVSGAINLEFINCSSNQLTSLNISQNGNLQSLNCNNNNLTSLDVFQNTILEFLYCYYNQLTSLDVSQNVNLQSLNCNNNNLTSLDVSQNVNLETLNCSYNQLPSLDVSQNTILEFLYCYNNQLTSLNLKNSNIYWHQLDFQNNPNMQYICADEADMFFVQGKIYTYGYINCHVNSYCSFNPGGTFYEISGKTKFDSNNNGCDVSDINCPNLKLSITDGTNTGSFIGNSTGDYYMPVQAGNHTITPILENPTYFNISPASFTVSFPAQASPFTQDFCVTANGLHSDVEIIVMPTTPTQPGFDADYKIVYRNKGNQVENGSVSLTFDDTILDYVSSNPVYDSSVTNTFTWNYTNLQPFETREIEITFNVNSPMESPAVNNGDILNYTTTITNANTDETPEDNTFILNQTVVGSYDPNDKTCIQGEIVDVSMVGEYVHYVIRFENTGTYPAENIVVKDMIDTSKFDISTLVPLHGSHEFFTRINSNKVEFIFENINLDFNDATNDGYIAFKIKTKNNLTVGQTFSNNASIYFDYNFPITTNTYTTTIDNLLNNQDFNFENEFVLYPNPTKNVLNISAKNQTEIKSVEIYNMVGQVVIAIPNTTKSIDVSSLETGTYFIKLNTEKGNTTTKFIKN